MDHLRKTSPVLEGSNNYLCSFQGDRLENVHFESKPRYLAPEIDHLGKMSPVLRISTHLYGVSKEINGKTSILIAILESSYRQIQLVDLNPRSASSSEWPFLISIVKAHTIK